MSYEPWGPPNMDAGEIRPALTAEEWAALRRMSRDAVADLTPPGTFRGWRGKGCGVRRGFSGDWPSASGEELHGIAALALHGQPFGFRWEDVSLLLDMADGFEREDPVRLRDLADRIAALLPPREP